MNSTKAPPRTREGEAILDTSEFTAEEYSAASRKMQGEHKRLIAFFMKLGIQDHAKVLEIGPGPGWIGILLTKQNPTLRITGLEISADMIRAATRNVKEEGVTDRITYIQGDAGDMVQFADRTFDAVITNGSLHHWEDPVRVLDEIARVLKRDGIFCISDGRRDLDWRGKLLFYLFKHFMPEFMQVGWKTSIMAGYTPEEVEGLLNQSALKGRYMTRHNFFDLLVFNKPNMSGLLSDVVGVGKQ